MPIHSESVTKGTDNQLNFMNNLMPFRKRRVSRFKRKTSGAGVVMKWLSQFNNSDFNISD